MAKEWEKCWTNCVKKLWVRLKYNTLLNFFVENYEEDLVKKGLWKIVHKNCVEVLGEKVNKTISWDNQVLVLLSLGSGTFCQAPFFCLNWSQLSDKVVLIVLQKMCCWTIQNTFQLKYRAVPILQQGGSNSPNGQNLSGNVDHQINLLCYSLSVNFKYLLVCLNQFIDAVKRKRH